jgi:L-aspartate oxidase
VVGDVDVLVVGSGVAGLSVALGLVPHLRVAVLAKDSDGGGSTQLAQGGIAAAVGPGDNWAFHAADTIAAAAGLGDPSVAQDVTAEAPEAVALLSRLGVRFDQGALAREGGHGRARVVHAKGDATGAEVSRALWQAARQAGVKLARGFLVDLVSSPGQEAIVGAVIWDGSKMWEVAARTVVLATGGYGQLWARTTSPGSCSGDGLAAAFRAGAQVADLEFVQFHPTGIDFGTDPRPLATEALRGAGARLRGADGEYINDDPGLDLAPRDVVSRAMARRMAELGSRHCYLDATPVGEAVLAAHFPTFVSTCHAADLDPARQWVPVAPTAHYTIGGVLTDSDGRTTVPGLMAVGEVASSGLHGANRLASNSLLEGAVIGRRAARLLLSSGGLAPPREPAVMDEVVENLAGNEGAMASGERPRLDRAGLRSQMELGAGVTRDADGLYRLAQYLAWPPLPLPLQAGWELANMVLLGRLVTASATRRRESRGAHSRADYPSSHPDWRVRQVWQMGGEGQVAVGNLEVPQPLSVAPALQSTSR